MPARSPLRPIARRALAAQSDERLVRLVREGHEPAFEEIVRRYRGALVAFAAAIVSADGAEDVVQGSLEKAHRALLGDGREIALRPWLFAIVRNGALNAVRREPRVDELGEAMAIAAGPSEIAEQREDLDRLVVAMCALPEAQRQALVKRELEGVGHGEIAAQLGTTSTAVRGLIFRARTGLRDAVGAIVPLPVIRSLLSEGAAAGAAGGGASMALLGGAGMKGGTVVAAAVVALGTGIAIDHGRNSGDRPAEAQAATSAKESPGRSSPSTSGEGSHATTTADTAAGSPSGGSASSGESAAGESEGGSSGPGISGGSSEEDRSGESSGTGSGADDSGSSGPGSGGSSGSSSGPGSGEHGTAPPPPEDGGHSGPGGGGHSGPGGGETSEPLVQEPPEEGGNSGPGGGGGESSGPGGGSSEPLQPLEPPEEGSSGSGPSGSGSGHGSGHDDPLSGDG